MNAIMKKHVSRQVRFLRATAIGGIFFLLPFAVLCFFLGQVAQVVYAVAIQLQPLMSEYLKVNDAMGYALLLFIAIIVLVLACFIAGILATRSIARNFTKWIEKYLLMMFPRYAIFKEQLSGNIGGDIARNRLRPVCVALNGYQSLGFEVERRAQVTVYLPGSPDPWAGSVVIVEPEQIRPLDVPFGDVLGAFEKLGDDTQALLHEECIHQK